MIMKKNIFLITIALLLVFGKTEAQEPTGMKRNEVGYNIVNYTSLTIPSDPVKQTFDMGFINGLYIKQHFEKNSLGIAFDHFNGNVKINGNESFDEDTLNTLGNWSQNILSAGIEKNYIDKKIFQLYWGLNLNLYYGIYNGQSQSLSGLYGYSTVKQDKGIGLTPLGGVRLTISEIIRFSLEANASSIVFSEVENRQEYLPSVKDEQIQTFNFVFRYGISFKISYLF